MVKFEAWNKETVQNERRANLKFKDAKDTLLTIESIGIESIVIFCPYTRNDVMVRTGAKGTRNYKFTFTNKQMKEIGDLLCELNGGKKPEWKWY